MCFWVAPGTQGQFCVQKFLLTWQKRGKEWVTPVGRFYFSQPSRCLMLAEQINRECKDLLDPANCLGTLPPASNLLLHMPLSMWETLSPRVGWGGQTYRWPPAGLLSQARAMAWAPACSGSLLPVPVSGVQDRFSWQS